MKKRTTKPGRKVKAEDIELNDRPGSLSRGDRVRSWYHPSESDMVRTLVSLRRDGKTASGYSASADGGAGGRPICDVDAAWFIPAGRKRK